jgi:hypothetical protein
MLPCQRVLCKTASRRHHLVETRNAVAGLEFPDIGADAVDDARDVVAAIGVVVGDDLGDLPGGVSVGTLPVERTASKWE